MLARAHGQPPVSAYGVGSMHVLAQCCFTERCPRAKGLGLLLCPCKHPSCVKDPGFSWGFGGSRLQQQAAHLHPPQALCLLPTSSWVVLLKVLCPHIWPLGTAGVLYSLTGGVHFDNCEVRTTRLSRLAR